MARRGVRIGLISTALVLALTTPFASSLDGAIALAWQGALIVALVILLVDELAGS
jgi:hypothetical protein